MPRKPNRQGSTFSYQDARKKLLARIIDEELIDGDLLPSIRTLAEEYTDGRLKPLRMAVKLLTDEGVLITHHGQGVFVKDARRAMELLLPVNDNMPAAPGNYAYDDMSPFAFQSGKRTLRVAICEINPDLRRGWNEIIEAFNTMSARITVQPVYYSFSDHTVTDAIGADIIQVQSHNRKRLPVSFRPLNLAPILNQSTFDCFLPSLFPHVSDDGAVTGLPVTAVAHCAAVNEDAVRDNWPSIPDTWESFDEYVEFILKLRKVAPATIKSVVYASNNLLFHLVLAGLASSNDVTGLPDFTMAPVRDLLSRFGRVYCRPDCYASVWSPQEANRRIDTWIRETHTYDVLLRTPRTGAVREFVPLPHEGSGRIPIISHLMCVNSQCATVEDAIVFLEYLSSDDVIERLLAIGNVPGHCRAAPRIHHVIRYAMEHGQLIEDSCPKLLELFTAKINPIVRRWQQGELTVDALCEQLERERLAHFRNGF